MTKPRTGIVWRDWDNDPPLPEPKPPNAREIAEMREAERLAQELAEYEADIFHPDKLGVSRWEPKSIYSQPKGRSRFGVGPAKKPKERLPKRPGVLVRHSRVYKPGVEY